jgi:hypothetical protein
MLVLFHQNAFHAQPHFYKLFGWDLKSMWQTANQKRCDALLLAGRLTEAHESYRYMMDMSNEIMKASCFDWSTGKSLLTPAG